MENTPAMHEMTPSELFEIERHNRMIDDIDSVDELRKIAKELLVLWSRQKAATKFFIQQELTGKAKPCTR